MSFTLGTQKVIKFVRIYVISTSLYGFTRAVSYDYKDTMRYFNRSSMQIEEKKMLLVDNIGNVVSRTFEANFHWPSMLKKDLIVLECITRGKNVEEYKII